MNPFTHIDNNGDAVMVDVSGKAVTARTAVACGRISKSRECYEVPGALTLITAHKALEDICVEGDLLKTKIKLEQDWATAVYNGQWYSPLKNALDAFMADTQKFVTGTVRLKFFKGNCHVVGRKSPFSLYDYGLATYDRDTTFDEKASAGFIEIDTLSLKTWAKVQGPSSAAAQA